MDTGDQAQAAAGRQAAPMGRQQQAAGNQAERQAAKRRQGRPVLLLWRPRRPQLPCPAGRQDRCRPLQGRRDSRQQPDHRCLITSPAAGTHHNRHPPTSQRGRIPGTHSYPPPTGRADKKSSRRGGGCAQWRACVEEPRGCKHFEGSPGVLLPQAGTLGHSHHQHSRRCNCPAGQAGGHGSAGE